MKNLLKTFIIVLGASWLAIILSACTPNSLNTGEIISKEYKDSYTSPYTICNQSHGGCITNYRFHPEEWSITLQGLNDDMGKGTRILYVSETVYNKVKIGETYTLTQEQIDTAQTDATWTPVLLIVGVVAMFSLIGFAFYTQLKRRPVNAA